MCERRIHFVIASLPQTPKLGLDFRCPVWYGNFVVIARSPLGPPPKMLPLVALNASPQGPQQKGRSQVYPESYRREEQRKTIVAASAFESAPRNSCALPTFAANPFRITLICECAPANPLESHTNKKPCIYVKTMGFKPFRDTYLRATFSQSLLNHILIKNAIGVGGTPAISSTSSTSTTSYTSNRQAPIFPVLLFLFRTGGW